MCMKWQKMKKQNLKGKYNVQLIFCRLLHEKRVKGSIFGQRHHKRCERISEGEHAPLKKLPDTLKQTKTTP